MGSIEIKVGDKKIRIGLDKFVLGIPYPKLSKHDMQNPPSQNAISDVADKQKEFVAKLHHIRNMIEVTGNCHVSSTKNKDLKRYKVLTDDGYLVCIFSLGFSFGTGVINLELNPSKMNQEKWEELHSLFAVTFNWHYQEFYEKCVVSHAEFFVDVPNENLVGLALIDEARRTTTKHMGTTYNGRRNSPLVATMYDKAKEQKMDGQLVRIEARINRRDIHFHDLVEHDLFNPLSTLLVVDVIQLQLVANMSGNIQLANQIREFGLYESVKNKYARKEILARLKENAVPWWQPELFWPAHRALLQQLQPEYAGT